MKKYFILIICLFVSTYLWSRWPVSGQPQVKASFGTYEHRRTENRAFHNGIDIPFSGVFFPPENGQICHVQPCTGNSISMYIKGSSGKTWIIQHCQQLSSDTLYAGNPADTSFIPNVDIANPNTWITVTVSDTVGIVAPSSDANTSYDHIHIESVNSNWPQQHLSLCKRNPLYQSELGEDDPQGNARYNNLYKNLHLFFLTT